MTHSTLGRLTPITYAIQQKPRCKCGRVCQYYGKVGGFSVSCRQCNAKNAKRQRDARARRKLQTMQVHEWINGINSKTRLGK